jgi:hypothetical protein
VKHLHSLRAWLSRVRLARLLGVLVLLTLVTTMPAADAAFSDSASLPSTTIATNQLMPPTGLTVSPTCVPPATVVFRGASSGSGQDKLTITKPAGVQADDVLVAQVTNSNGLYTNLNAPAGWVLLGRTSSGGQVTAAVFYKVAAAVEPSSFTFRLVGSSGVPMAGGIAAFDGVWTGDPVDGFGVATGLGASATTPSVTTSVAGTVLLRLISKREDDVPAPAGTTPLWQLPAGTGSGAEGATASHEGFAGPGVTPSRTSTTVSTSEWVTHTVALRATPATANVNAAWTASASDWAAGYLLERVVNGAVQASGTVAPASATSSTDGPLSIGVTYTYRVSAYFRSWTSAPATAVLTTNC